MNADTARRCKSCANYVVTGQEQCETCRELEVYTRDRVAKDAEIAILRAELERVKAERLRWYKADGTFEVLESAEAVIEKRKEAAKTLTRIAELEASAEGWKDAYFKLIRAIGSSPNSSRPPVLFATALLERMAALEAVARDAESAANYLCEMFDDNDAMTVGATLAQSLAKLKEIAQ